MVIITANYDDLQSILDLQYLAFQREAEEFNDFSIQPLNQTIDEIKNEFEKFKFMKAIDDDGRIIGSVRGYVNDGTSYICTLIVHPDFQGKGIGTQLISAIESINQAPRYEIHSSIRCPQNIKLYEHLKFIKFRETQTSNNGFVYLEKYNVK
ncbi:MAG: hypothetical protein A2Y15_05995 [Clostridiales bacterium GWF2_36_10]|nr:MAG: hypothetical protein A2Y15_05995 [Clostridiales bacterium GWF2_36_10]HAN21590.1 GNAT family N-acetyltransferase [Clostridiales bacterium]